MMSAPAIIALLREHHTNYELQDNVFASKVARILADIIDEAETPDLDELRKKFLG